MPDGRPPTFGFGVAQLTEDQSAWRGDLLGTVSAIEREHPEIECLWTSDRVLGEVPALEPMTLLGFLAAETSRVRLGVATVVLPLRNPVELARLASTVDQLSCGRLVLGIGAGSDEHRMAAQYPSQRWGPHYERALSATLDLLASVPVTLDGSMLHLRDAVIGQSPSQRPLPVWLGGHAKGALARAARLATGWIGSGVVDKIAFDDSVATLRHALESCGRAPGSFTIAKRTYVQVARPGSEDEIAQWSKRLFGDPATGHRIVVTGTPRQCCVALEQLVESGTDHLIVDPVTFGEGDIETLLGEVLAPLARSVS